MKGSTLSALFFQLWILAGGSGAAELQTTDGVQVYLFEHGYRVLTEPALGAEVKKEVPGPSEVNIAAWMDTPEGRFYLSDWSLDRRNKGESYFWVLANGPMESPVQEEEKAPPPTGIAGLWNALWDEQTTPYSSLEFGRVLLPLLSAAEGPEAPRTLAVELMLGATELELGLRAPGNMHVNHATPPLLGIFRQLEATPDLFDAGAEDAYDIGWVLKSRVAGDLAEILLSQRRFEDVRTLIRASAEEDQLRRPLFQLTLRLAEGETPSGIAMLELAEQLDEYERESYVALLEERGYEPEAALLAGPWGLWSRSLRDSPEALGQLLARTGDDATKALILQRLGDTASANELWENAISETVWDIDLGLEHRDLFSGVPSSFGTARDLGVPESFLAPALERTVETLRRTANRIQSGGWSDMAETFLDAELPALAGSGRFTADAALALKGCMLEREVFVRRLAAYRDRADLVAWILRWDALEKEYDAVYGDQAGNEEAGLGIEREMDEVLQSLLTATGDSIFKVRSNRVTSRRVQEALPPTAALVEFVKYSRGYAAVVVTPDREPLFIDLARSGILDRLVEELRSSLVPPPDDTRTDEVLEETFQRSSSRLYDLIAAPIETAVGTGVTDLVLSLDGDLHFLPLSALLAPDGRFWAEQRKLIFVNSGRDLVIGAASVADGTRNAVLFGNPVFQIDPAPDGPLVAFEESAARTLRSGLRLGECIDVSKLAAGIESLPGTKAEVAGLNTLLENAGFTVTLFTEGDASETNLYEVRSPRILHLATHGFCLPGLITGQGATEGAALVTEPMQLSSLALTGACNAYARWSLSGLTPAGEDGIVLAREISGMNLQGTELVTLSACETGLGLSTRNHGVQGLKTALLTAGARNLLLSLWPVSDVATVDFMEAFYRRFASGQNPSQACHEAQVEMLSRFRTEHSSARVSAALAAPFVLTCGGPPWP